ncbi:DinB family protein [Flectobacillus roseus]|uniref:DinB family protein n=1 Tax=Flectobacillus roseus TaxID=502259 RepID=UPI0024B7EFF6|nr:DinB family protein [Flectobacillus roseus]MDI9867671.1 DinB family protein [Flectobacillus roseus]
MALTYFDTKEELLDFLTQLAEKQLDKTVEWRQSIDAKTLLQPSETGGWSVAQCLSHLNAYSNYYLQNFRERMLSQGQFSQNHPIKSTWLGKLAIKSMHPDTGKSKFKAMKGYIPSSKLPAFEVLDTFISHQKNLLEILKVARNYQLNQITIPISIAKFLTLRLADALYFLIIHQERHILQAERNIKGK